MSIDDTTRGLPQHSPFKTVLPHGARFRAVSAEPDRRYTHHILIDDDVGGGLGFTLAPGQAHELPHAVPLLGCLLGVPRLVVADRGYSSHALREHVWSLGARTAIPTRRTEASVACPDFIYANRMSAKRGLNVTVRF